MYSCDFQQTKSQPCRNTRLTAIYATLMLYLAVFCSAIAENIPSVAIVSHNKRKILNVKFFHRFTAQLLKSHYLARLYAVAGKCARTSYSTEIDRTISYHSVPYLL